MKSQAQLRVERSEYLKTRVMQILDWTEMQYCEFQYEQGMVYLNTYINDTFILERSRIFWNWWKNHWTTRDEMFIVTNMFYGTMNAKRYRYQDLNCGVQLVTSVHPNRVILENSYTQMVDQIIKETRSESFPDNKDLWSFGTVKKRK